MSDNKPVDYDYENKRWENGVKHHPMSVRLMEWMMDVDFNTGDNLELKIGGDGDNGETLMFLMDGFFERNGFQQQIDTLMEKNAQLEAEVYRLKNQGGDSGFAGIYG